MTDELRHDQSDWPFLSSGSFTFGTFELLVAPWEWTETDAIGFAFGQDRVEKPSEKQTKFIFDVWWTLPEPHGVRGLLFIYHRYTSAVAGPFGKLWLFGAVLAQYCCDVERDRDREVVNSVRRLLFKLLREIEISLNLNMNFSHWLVSRTHKSQKLNKQSLMECFNTIKMF